VALLASCSGGSHDDLDDAIQRTLASTSMHFDLRSGDERGAMDYRAPDRMQTYDGDAVSAVSIGRRTYESFCGRWGAGTLKGGIDDRMPRALFQMVAHRPTTRTSAGYVVDLGRGAEATVTVVDGRIATIRLPVATGTDRKQLTFRLSRFDRATPPITAPPRSLVDEGDAAPRLVGLGFLTDDPATCLPGTGPHDLSGTTTFSP
jgi:hypothetical protein